MKYSKLCNVEQPNSTNYLRLNEHIICDVKDNCFEMLMLSEQANTLEVQYIAMCIAHCRGPAATEGVMGVRRQARDVPDANHCTAFTTVSYIQVGTNSHLECATV